MKTTNLYKFYMPEDFVEVIPDDLFQWLHTSVEVDISKLSTLDGLGIFIREKLDVGKEKDINIALVAEWHTTKSDRVVSFLRYHVFKGDMPDNLLDDINFVAANTNNPVWEK